MLSVLEKENRSISRKLDRKYRELWNQSRLSCNTFCGLKFRMRNHDRITLDVIPDIRSVVVSKLLSFAWTSIRSRNVNPCSRLLSRQIICFRREISLAFFREVTIKITSFRYQLFFFLLVEVREKKRLSLRGENRGAVRRHNKYYFLCNLSIRISRKLFLFSSLYYSAANEKSSEEKLSIETRQIARSEYITWEFLSLD